MDRGTLAVKIAGWCLGAITILAGGCAENSDAPGPAGQVKLVPTAGTSALIEGINKDQVENQSATLEIVNFRNNIPLTVQADGSVTGTISGVPVGEQAFVIRYFSNTVQVYEVTLQATVVENQEVVATELDKTDNFHDDTDPAPNLVEVRAGTDPKNPLSFPVVAAQITAGAEHSCARITDGTVRCWGSNSEGQLGDDSGPGTRSLVPVQVAGIDGVSTEATWVSAGDSHSCAALKSGEVQCWGRNTNGQLGTGVIFPNSPLPVTVTGIESAVSVTAGGNHTCARLTDETVRCWGRNEEGQLGSGAAGSNQPTPSPVRVPGFPINPFLQGVQAVTAGANHTCAHIGTFSDFFFRATSSPTRTLSAPFFVFKPPITILPPALRRPQFLVSSLIRCWGNNLSGQLGTGTNDNSTLSVETKSLVFPNILVAAGSDHVCTVDSGSVKCWGENASRQVNPNDIDDRAEPSIVPLGSVPRGTQASLDAGRNHSCTLLTDNRVRCWGSNALGQLGTPSASATGPIEVSGITTATSVAAGANHSCAVLGVGIDGVRCWGSNSEGQLGDDGASGDHSATPVVVQGLAGGT